jgi:NAD(P)-dependent dehydrogenase (short-subunit alcohol dehydrogenase family)
MPALRFRPALLLKTKERGMTTSLITGANRGIGLELAQVMLENGHDVIACCRNSSDDLNATSAEVMEGVDIGDSKSVAALAERLGNRRIDILVNNAGVAAYENLDDVDYDNAVHLFNVNALGALRITQSLQSNVPDGGKVVVVTSLMASLGDNGVGGFYSYRMSKAAANTAGVNLAHHFRPRGIAVLLLHPGVVATEMTGGNGKPPREAGEKLYAAIERGGLDDSGKVFSLDGKQEPW